MTDSQKSPRTKVRAKKGILHTELGEEAVLLNLDSGVYFGLNPVGRLIWQELEDSATLSHLIAKVSQTFDQSPQDVENDVFTFVSELDANGLIEIQ